MAPVRNILLLSAAAATSAYAPASSFTSSRSAAFRPSKTFVNENFGFDFAEDQSEMTPDIILGEANLKQWVGTVNDNSFLNRQVRPRNCTNNINRFVVISLTFVNIRLCLHADITSIT